MKSVASLPSVLIMRVLLCGMMLPVAGCGEHKADTDSARLPAAAVNVQAVESKRYVVSAEAAGTVGARLHARIEAKVAGLVIEMLAVPGQAVQAGDRLARLDVQEIRARLDQALAVRTQAERELQRERKLIERGAATRAEVDAAQARADVARAAVAEAETMLRYADVIAPFAGVVTRKLADIGDLAAPGRPLLEMEDPTQLQLQTEIPEALINSVKLGAHMSVQLSGMPSELQATVSEVAPAADPNSRTFRVKLDLPQSDRLRSGQFGRVSVPIGERDGLRVPANAVVQRGQLEMVFVVADHRAHMRLVKTGKAAAGELEILSGLESGETVVVEGAAALVDGQPVEVRS
jgi:RND family efflux transporter MFP subunit